MRITTLILRGTEAAAELAKKLDAFVREVTSIINGGIRITENLAATVKTVRFTDGDDLTISTRYLSAPATVMVLSAREANADSSTMSGNRVTWDFSSTHAGGVVTISSISDLTASTEYVVTLAIVEA